MEVSDNDNYNYVNDNYIFDNSTLMNASDELFGNKSSANLTEDVDYTDAIAMDQIFAILVPILFGLIVMIGLFGNALVVIVVGCNQQMRNTTNLLIFNLAMADLLFIVFCVPFTATDYAMPFWPFGNVWCRIVQYLIIVCAYTSVYTLVLMSLDRFLAVVHPVASMNIRTERNTYFAIAIVWIVILLACIPALVAHGMDSYIYAHEKYDICTFLKENHNYPAYQIIFFLSSYVIPLALICILYLFMLKRLWYGVSQNGHVSAQSLAGKKRATRLVVVVVVIFAVCWCPIQVVLVLKSLEVYDLTAFNVAVQIISQIFAYMNSCVNPILYAFLSDNFRKAFHKVISCGASRSTSHTRMNSEKSEMRMLNTKSKRYFSNDTETTQAIL